MNLTVEHLSKKIEQLTSDARPTLSERPQAKEHRGADDLGRKRWPHTRSMAEKDVLGELAAVSVGLHGLVAIDPKARVHPIDQKQVLSLGRGRRKLALSPDDGFLDNSSASLGPSEALLRYDDPRELALVIPPRDRNKLVQRQATRAVVDDDWVLDRPTHNVEHLMLPRMRSLTIVLHNSVLDGSPS